MHEQVQKQLEYLKRLVDIDKEEEADSKRYHMPYIPSRLKGEHIYDYNRYKQEIAKNGDKNLLVMVKYKGKILPFARQYADLTFDMYFLVHRREDNGEILLREDKVEVVN